MAQSYADIGIRQARRQALPAANSLEHTSTVATDASAHADYSVWLWGDMELPRD
jgi:hypothetical protein